MEDVNEGDKLADVQPVMVTRLKPYTSTDVMEWPGCVAHTSTLYFPGASPVVFQVKVGSVLKSRRVPHFPFGYWTQYL